MAGVYDELVGRLRKDYQLNLEEVFTSNDLKNAFDNMKGGQREQSKDNLKAGASTIFETEAVEKEVNINKVNKSIDDIKDVSDVIVIEDFSDIKDEIRDGKKLKNKFEDKVFDVIPDADKNEIKEITKARNLVDDKRLFDLRITERENELRKEDPMSLERKDLLDLGYRNRSLRKASNELGLSQDRAIELFEREGFRIDERGQIRT